MTEQSAAVADMLLAGRYRLERPVASGPCTTLWRAFDEVLTRPVAVKVLDTPGGVPGCATVDEAASRFTTAATSVGRLAHPQIASIYDAGVEDGLPYIVTEWVEGSAVGDLVREAPLRPTRATTIGAQATEAIRYAHSTGVPHGDIDGFNVLVCPDGSVKLTDFGVAAALSDHPAPAELAALPPEQRDTKELAALVYLCLTGRSVYGREDGLSPAPYADGRLLSPRQVRAGVPRDIDAVVMRALDPVGLRGATPITTTDQLLTELARLPGEEPEQPTIALPLDRPQHGAPPAQAAPHRPGWPRIALPLVLVLALVATAVVVAVQLGVFRDEGTDPAASPSPSQQATTRALTKVRLSTVDDFDPEGSSNSEHPEQVGLVADGDPSTAWRTERYDSATLGNLKSGVGLVLDLGRPVAVREVRVALLDPGATVQLRAADSPGPAADSYRVVAEASAAQKRLILTPRRGTTAQYWLLWFTKLPQGDGGFRAQVGEVEFFE